MKFTIEKSDGIVIFRLKASSIDSDISAQLKAEILIVSQPDIKALIVDLESVDYIDSAGMGALLLAHRQLREHAIPVILVSVKDVVLKIFDLLNLSNVFVFKDSVKQAIEDLD